MSGGNTERKLAAFLAADVVEMSNALGGRECPPLCPLLGQSPRILDMFGYAQRLGEDSRQHALLTAMPCFSGPEIQGWTVLFK